ncbi:MAG: hypothetical protein U0V74_04140 [Chitinophagales bacterium]
MFKETIDYPANTVTYLVTAPAVKLPVPLPELKGKRKEAPGIQVPKKKNGHFLCGNELTMEDL